LWNFTPFRILTVIRSPPSETIHDSAIAGFGSPVTGSSSMSRSHIVSMTAAPEASWGSPAGGSMLRGSSIEIVILPPRCAPALAFRVGSSSSPEHAADNVARSTRDATSLRLMSWGASERR
jgi:hypothetical protein